MNELTDYPCDLKLWLLYIFFTIIFTFMQKTFFAKKGLMSL